MVPNVYLFADDSHLDVSLVITVCVCVSVCPHRGLLQTVQEVMMQHLEVGVDLIHQGLSCFLGRLQGINRNHMSTQ